MNTIVETFTDMHTQLQKEKNSMKAIWNEREKQIQQLIDSTTGMYGEMRGIIGRTLPQIESLGLGPGEENEE